MRPRHLGLPTASPSSLHILAISGELKLPGSGHSPIGLWSISECVLYRAC